MRAQRLATLFAILLVFTVASAATAADLLPAPLQGDALLQSAAGFTYLDTLAQNNVFMRPGGVELMRQYSTSLDPFFKKVLYDRYARDPWGAATLNLFTGGLGSLFMKDTVPGIILETGMAISYGAFFAAMTMPQTKAWGLDTASEIGAVVFGVAGIVWPFLTALPWNKKLKESLAF
jgi:hypothetical protein